MRKSIQDLIDFLLKTGLNVVTFKPTEFEATYRNPDDDKIKYMLKLKLALEPFNFCIAFGTNATIIVKDANFAFQNIEEDILVTQMESLGVGREPPDERARR